MSIENFKINPGTVTNPETIDKDAVANVTPSQEVAHVEASEALAHNPSTSEIRHLAEDLMKTHGEKFSSLFGAATFVAEKAKVDEAKKRKAENLSAKIIQRIHVTSQDEMRNFVADCLDDVYKNDQVINALTDYMCQHYEIMNDVELPRTT